MIAKFYWIKGLSFISNRQRRKEGTFCASQLAGIEPTPPAPEEQDIFKYITMQYVYGLLS